MDDKTNTHQILAKGTEVDQYRIIEKIGSGGMGEVYLADDTRLDRQVALKFLPAHLSSDQEIKSRFIREAKAAAKLQHPHIVTVFEVGEYRGRPFIAMEYVKGQLVHQLAKEGNLSVNGIVDIAIQLCQGLGEAHRAGVIHRDIKSANIAVDNSGRIRILDFGLAAVAGTEQLTKTGSTLGTISYMSPEQVSGRGIDHRSDLFSLGVVLYELIASRTPFKRDNEGATLKAIIEDIPEPLSRYRSGVPDSLQAIISKLLEKDKEVRYQSAEGVLADLKKLLYDSQPSTSQVYRTKNRAQGVLLAAAVAIAVLTAGWAIFFREPATTTVGTNAPVLAVLPFENLGLVEDDYFSEGVADEIRSRLSAVEGLRVIGRRSTEKYKGTNLSVEEIGDQLGADFLVEATVRWDKSGDVDRVRIIPTLTRASSAVQLWSGNFEESLTEIFTVQSLIADQIAHELGLTLLESSPTSHQVTFTSNMEAYNYYLKGLELARRGAFSQHLSSATEMFDSALALDSGFALAWARKSVAHSRFAFSHTNLNNDFHVTSARESAERALAIDPALAAGRIALGTYYALVERRYEDALSEFDKAKSEVANDPEILESIGIVKMRQGKWYEAISNFERASQVDPLNVQRYYFLTTSSQFVRNFAEAKRYADRALTLDPAYLDAIFTKLMNNLLLYGTLDGPDATFEEIVKPAGIANHSGWQLVPSSSFGFWRFMRESHWTRESITEMLKVEDDHEHYLSLMQIGEIFSLMRIPDSSQFYFDSARVTLENLCREVPDDFHAHGSLGLTYARLGMFEQAIRTGIRGKELINDCHW